MSSPITLPVLLSPAQAALRGLDTHGIIELPVAPSTLTPGQREMLVELLRRNAPIRTGDRLDTVTAAELPPVPITADAVPSWLDDCQAAKAAAVERLQAEREKRVLDLLAKPPELWRGNGASVIVGTKILYRPQVSKPTDGWIDDPRINARREEIARDYLPAWEAEHERIVAALQAEVAARDAASQAERAAKQAAEQRRTQQLAAWLAEHGTDPLRKRAARDLLPQDELLAAYRDWAFRALADLPRYRRLTDADVRAGLDLYDGATVEYTTRTAESVSDATLALIECIEQALPAAQVTPLDHVGYAADAGDDSDPEVVRQSLRVTITVGDITVSREYAAA